MRVDSYSRGCLAIEAGQSMTGAEVATIVERLVKVQGDPDRIQCDNGSQFISRAFGSCRWRTHARRSRSGAGITMSSGRTVRSET